MSLRDQFAPDMASVFINTDEFATVREFRISNGAGGFLVFSAPVVWDIDSVKKEPIVSIHGVFMGDVRCYIERKYLPRFPVAGELIYSPANHPWEVLDCTDEESCVALSLAAYRSQPTQYGSN